MSTSQTKHIKNVPDQQINTSAFKQNRVATQLSKIEEPFPLSDNFNLPDNILNYKYVYVYQPLRFLASQLNFALDPNFRILT